MLTSPWASITKGDVMSLAMEIQLKANEFFTKNREVLFNEAQGLNPSDSEGEFDSMKKKFIDNLIQEKAAKAFGEIVDMTNGIQPRDLARYFLIGLNQQHRYLQAEFWNTIVHLMKLYAAQDSRNFDQRNELSRIMCEEISANW